MDRTNPSLYLAKQNASNMRNSNIFNQNPEENNITNTKLKQNLSKLESNKPNNFNNNIQNISKFPSKLLTQPKTSNKNCIIPICPIHESEIGGSCDNYDCLNKQQIFCLKCVAEPTCCIRSQKHQFIPINEMIFNFTDQELISIKSDMAISRSLSLSDKYLSNSENLKKEFLEKSTNIQDEINTYYMNLIEFVQNIQNDFNEKFGKLINSNYSLLVNSLENIDDLISYERLCKFQKNDLLEKSSMLNFESLNTLINSMKKSINNLKNKNCEKYLDNIKNISDMEIQNDNIFQIKKKFEDIQTEINKKHSSFCNNLQNNIFPDEKVLNNTLTELSLLSEFSVDFSVNSNFLDKKFTIFDHSNGNGCLAYPTSQNTIKIVYLNKILKDKDFFPKENKNGFENNNKNIKISIKDFDKGELLDKYLYFKLASHGGRITQLRYYRLPYQGQDKDLLISSSEDKCIKIWDITNLNKYLDDVNEFYRNNCVKTLTSHENKIGNFVNFYDALKIKNYIVSTGVGDRIKVWDIQTGRFIRDVIDSTKSPNFDSELNVFHEKNSSRNMMVTSGHNSSVRVWDFDTGKILKVFNYREKILELVYFEDPKNRIFIFDDSGKCGFLEIEKNLNNKNNNLENEYNFLLKAGNVYSGNTYRNALVRWNDSTIFSLCKNGQIYEYDSDKLTNLNNINVGNSSISHGFKYHDLVYGDLLVVHSHDQKIKVFK